MTIPIPMMNKTSYYRDLYYGSSSSSSSSSCADQQKNYNSGSHGGGNTQMSDVQLKLCSITCTTFSETATRTASVASSSTYDFLSIGGSACLLGPISVSSDYDDNIAFDLHDDDEKCIIESTMTVTENEGTRHKREQLETTTMADEMMVGQARIEDGVDKGIASVVELSETIPREQNSALRQPCGADGDDDDNDKDDDKDDDETQHCCGGAYGASTIEDDDTRSIQRQQPQGGYGSFSLAASDQVAVLAFSNRNNNDPNNNIENSRHFPKVPDMITFTNNYNQKNLKYTSLRDLLKCDTNQNDGKHSIDVADNYQSPFKHEGNDVDSHESTECHTSVCSFTTGQNLAGLPTSYIDLEVTNTQTSTKLEFLTVMDDNDFYRKTDICIPAKLSEKLIFEDADMLLISEAGILKINDFDLDICAKRVDSKCECACVVM